MSAAPDRKNRFEAIFAKHEWGGDSRSGPGSDPHSTSAYVEFLNGWLRDRPDLKSIVEVGCGDWATSSRVEFGPRQYLGVDIVEALIAQNNARYGSETISFTQADFVEDELPPADLLIAKDVLQHLSNESVSKFIARHFRRFKYLILVNDVEKTEFRTKFLFTRKKTLDVVNRDIADGESRPLRLDLHPFDLRPIQRLAYDTLIRPAPRKIVYRKEILVCAHNPAPGPGR